MDSLSSFFDLFGDFILSSQVYTNARDLARFGMLYLQNGVWNGERLLSSTAFSGLNLLDGAQRVLKVESTASALAMYRSQSSGRLRRRCPELLRCVASGCSEP